MTREELAEKLRAEFVEAGGKLDGWLAVADRAIAEVGSLTKTAHDILFESLPREQCGQCGEVILGAEMNMAASILWRALGCPPGLIDPVKMAEDAAALIASLREQLDYARDIAIEHGEARDMAYDRDHPDD